MLRKDGMHKESYNIVKRFERTILSSIKSTLSVLDVGSLDINGTYRPLFKRPKYYYTGIDLIPGENVDHVIGNDYQWDIYQRYDVVICGNVIEHTPYPFQLMDSIVDACVPLGYICIVTPFNIGIHRYPKDYFRVLPDAFIYRMGETCKILRCEINNSGNIKDTYIFAQKK